MTTRPRDPDTAPSSEPIELASPACLAHEMDDRYMGFATREEILAVLNELLEAGRARTRAALAIAEEGGGTLAPLAAAMHREETHGCEVLARAIQRLAGTASTKTGAIYEEAMANADPRARLALLERGREEIVRRLKAFLPTVRDEELHADLAALLAFHEHGIRLAAGERSGPG